jgi:putative transposase
MNIVCSCESREKRPFYFGLLPNGKIERFHRTIKGDCIRPETPLSLEDARRIVTRYVEQYNTERLHSAIGYVTPQTKLDGREKTIFAERDRKLETARERRKEKRQATRQAALDGQPAVTTT